MKKLFYINLLLVLMASCASEKKCASTKEMVVLDKNTNEVTLKVGQPCEIQFITNASTGYWWQWVNSNEITVVDSIGEHYTSTAPVGMVGASSTRHWKFEAKKKGTETLKFVYARSNRDDAIKTREVTIKVK